jgi:hypothetical protein
MIGCLTICTSGERVTVRMMCTLSRAIILAVPANSATAANEIAMRGTMPRFGNPDARLRIRRAAYATVERSVSKPMNCNDVLAPLHLAHPVDLAEFQV